MNDKDKDRRGILKVVNSQTLAAHRLNADPSNFVINQNSLADALTDYVTTVRREARAEAFKEAIAIVKAEAWTTSHDKMIAALERAAESREGGDDG